MRNIINTKILLSGATILGAAAIIIGATYAFFSDTETSQNNKFDGGVLDLLIDNTSYYNGQISQDTTWGLDDLDGRLFFNFQDVKPGDWGEDTISIHVNNNDAWACVDSTLTSDDENEATALELADNDVADDANNLLDGELGQNLNFIFWADDGDNVLEDNETDNIFASGSANTVLNGLSVTLADSLTNLFGGNSGDPLQGTETYYIAKAWCFGTLAQTPVAAGQGQNPTVASGISCDGSGLSNITQTDKLTADITFTAMQHRNNPDFSCNPTVSPTVSPTPTLTPTPTGTPEPGEVFGDAVTSVAGTFGHCCDQNNLSSSTAVAAASVTGAPDSPPDSDFIQISDNSSVTIQFNNNKAVAGVGSDIRIHVYDALFPADALVEVSDNPSCSIGFVNAGIHSDTANVDIDINALGLTQAFCVRITDQVAGGDPFPTLGFDLDAIEALNSQIYP